jgi:hypothetical protein
VAKLSRSFAFSIHPQRTLVSRSILILGGGSVNQASQGVSWCITSNSMAYDLAWR